MATVARRSFVAGNWKMFTTLPEAAALVKALRTKLVNIKNVEVAVFPPATNLTTVIELLKHSAIQVGAQNLYWEEQGAFTGEISAAMITSCGCELVLIGHSERRQYFGETDDTVNRRTKRALAAGLRPIICVGESLAQREGGEMQRVVEMQVRGALADISPADFGKTVIAYEPVWAIGTGVNATPEQAQEAHAFIRMLLSDLYGSQLAQKCRIQYGGSVKPGNAAELMAQSDIDGALVGGASLQADSFADIVKAAENLAV